jgi:hypothetical protein
VRARVPCFHGKRPSLDGKAPIDGAATATDDGGWNVERRLPLWKVRDTLFIDGQVINVVGQVANLPCSGPIQAGWQPATQHYQSEYQIAGVLARRELRRFSAQNAANEFAGQKTFP